jgi:hypothetical protein
MASCDHATYQDRTVILATTDPAPLVAIIAAILGGGGIGAIVAYRKAGPEVESISVNTLKGVIQEMRTELERKDRTIDGLNHRLGEQQQQIAELAERIHQLEMEPPPHLA